MQLGGEQSAAAFGVQEISSLVSLGQAGLARLSPLLRVSSLKVTMAFFELNLVVIVCMDP